MSSSINIVKDKSNQESRDGQLLFEVEIYLKEGCIMVSVVESG